MGSRGASSKGTAGEHGAGMLGKRRGGAGATPQDAQYLSDQIGKGGTQFADEIMSTRDDLESVYGESVKNLTLMTAKFSDSSIGGCYEVGADTVYMNEKNINNPALTETMKLAAKQGFHPSIGTFTGAEAVAAHEIGHGMADFIEKTKGVTAMQIVAKAGKKIGVSTENVAGHISGYARYNYHETVAEACTDVYCNGNKASKASKAIMAEVKNYLS